jgi:SAM-dependent methyltransferase
MTAIEFVPYPPTSFPFRDLLVLEQLELRTDRQICEIGVGSGETTARLARVCAGVTGFDVSRPALEALAYLQRRHPNLRLIAADVTDAVAMGRHAEQYDGAFSCDTLEHVADPAGFFRGIATLLAPGGELAVTFPNEPLDRMHGVTRFDRPDELRAHLERAGLIDVRLGAARLTPHAERIARNLGWRPLAAARRALAAGHALARLGRRGGTSAGESELPPQVFDETRFFRDRQLWRRLSPAVNLYWYGVLRLMAARGPSFVIDWGFGSTSFEHCQVFVTARKPARLAAAA